MADKENKKNNEDEKAEEKDQDQQSGTKTSILAWIIMVAVVVLLGGSGFVLGRLFAGSSSPGTTEPPQENAQKEKITTDGSTTGSGNTWYFNDLESVVVNPDVPGATRFVRVGLILEMNAGLNEDETKELIEAQKPLLLNWLNLYFKSLTLEEMEDDNDLKRILSQICDAFNEILFPDAEPQIKKILIREFNIQ